MSQESNPNAPSFVIGYRGRKRPEEGELIAIKCRCYAAVSIVVSKKETYVPSWYACIVRKPIRPKSPTNKNQDNMVDHEKMM
jgi:hypothetical protein